MAKLEPPQLAPGNLLRLIQELHRLHADAGWPSARRMARELPVSHTTVHELFTKERSRVPDKKLIITVGRMLAGQAVTATDVSNVEAKLAEMWRAADREPFSVGGQVLDRPGITDPVSGHELSRTHDDKYEAPSPALSGAAPWLDTILPLGATYREHGTVFAIFSEVAERVELCLFADDDTEQKFDMASMDGNVWHRYMPDIPPGQRYGYRVVSIR